MINYCQFKILPQERRVILRDLHCIDTEELPSAQLPSVSLSFSLLYLLLLCDCVLKAHSVCPGSHNLTLVVTWKVSNQ